jgi:hypothetical protein
VKAFITAVLPIAIDRVDLQWDLEEVSESGTFGFALERSGSPGGPWTEVATFTDVYLGADDLNDEDANIFSLSRDIYYRIKVTPPSGAVNTFYSPVVNLDNQAETEVTGPDPAIGYKVIDPAQREPDPETNLTKRPLKGRHDVRRRLLRRKILRNEYIMLKKLNGIEFYVLKRRHFGTRCTNCYDPTTREVTRSHCPYCYGTSWQGGYFDPVLLYGRRLVSQVQTDRSQQSKTDIDQTRIQFLDYPKLDEGDILVERAHNRRFLVKSRYYTSLKTITVHQTVTVSELQRQAKEYDVAVTLP